MCGSKVIADIILAEFLESNQESKKLVLCGNESETLVCRIQIENASDFEVRKNSCYFEDLLDVAKKVYPKKFSIETDNGTVELINLTIATVTA